MTPHFFCSVCKQELETTHMSGGNAEPDEPLDYYVEPHVCHQELESAEVVGFDGFSRTVVLRFDLMPCAAIGERWLVSMRCKP